MSNAIETLRAARTNLVKMRLQWAEVLAAPFERGRTEQAIARVVELQQAIVAIEAAIAHEENAKPATSSRQELRL
jgi:hypothetical protein